MQGVRGSNPLSSTRHNMGRRWRITRLPTEHHAGQGAGDAVHDLDAGDHQPAQLIQTGRLHPGDEVVGPARSSASCTPSRPLSTWATWATLPISVSMSTYALSTALASSAFRHATLSPDRWLPMSGGRMLSTASQPGHGARVASLLKGQAGTRRSGVLAHGPSSSRPTCLGSPAPGPHSPACSPSQRRSPHRHRADWSCWLVGRVVGA
jgi:hypothetical protein